MATQELENNQDGSGPGPLHQAATEGNEEAVVLLLRLLKDGAEANSKDGKCVTPLMHASWKGHLGVVQTLLQVVGDEGLREVDEEGQTVLHHAAFGGHEEVVNFLVSQGAQANGKARRGKTALMYASWGGHLGVVEKLLQVVGEQVLTEMDAEGHTALHFSADKGHEEVADFLLSHGAQANSKDGKGMTPLMQASIGGYLAVAKRLLQVVGDQGLTERDEDGVTALHHAASGGHEALVCVLLGHGAEANSMDLQGCTPLMHASWNGHLGVVQKLLQVVGGQGLKERDEDGWTALHYAAHLGHEELVDFLLSHGAGGTSKDVDGKTPPMLACTQGHLGILRALLRHTEAQGLNLTDADGSTALHLVCMEGYAEYAGDMVRALLLAGADATIMGRARKTARTIAEAQGCHELVDVFEWWAAELERPYLLHRAKYLNDLYIKHPEVFAAVHAALHAAPLPAFLKVRALPRVEVVAVQHEQRGTVGSKASAEARGTQEGGEERHAVLTYVMKEMNEQLYIELLDGFHAPIDG